MFKTPSARNIPIIIHVDTSKSQFSTLAEFISQTLGEGSRKTYATTYRKWTAFAKRHGINALDLSFENIHAFISESELAFSTRLSMKTHMLRLLDWLEESESQGKWYARQRRRVVKFVKIKRLPTDIDRTRRHRALSKGEVAQLLDVYADDTRPVGARNNALLRLMIYTGLRRAEVVVLRWVDIDLEFQTVHVR